MIKKIASMLFGFSSVSQPASALADETASANSDRWMVYERLAFDSKPLVVVARTGNVGVQKLLLNGRATVVTCRTDHSNVNVQGMPQGTASLYAIEDKLDEAPALLEAGGFRVASVTGQGQRRMFFVHRDPLDLSPVIRTVQVQGFSCEASNVEDRQALIHLVTPTHLESQMNGDRDVIASLEKGGDDGHAPRKTDFWFYGQRESLGSLAANLKAHGFSVDHWVSSPTGVVLSRKMPVDLAAFETLTPIIVSAAEQFSVDYDGWETVVVSEASTLPNGKTDR